jgi:ComF family protein
MYFADLILPRVCPVCGRVLLSKEMYLCLYCTSDLPLSHFWAWQGNPAESCLAGKISAERVSSLMLYREESPYAKIIHAFKYMNKRGLCRFMGEKLGEKLFSSGYYNDVDCIIPVPLHPLKRWMRGYNQAEILSEAVGCFLGVPVIKGALVRRRYTATQTRKKAGDRFKNVSGAFKIRDKRAISGKHLLLVDDVMTTGATLISCAEEILKLEGCKISIATLAFVE